MNYGIIAAGEGSRLVSEGVECPKPLVEIDGRPMIGRLIDIFVRNGAERIVVCVNEEMTEVRKYLEQVSRDMSGKATELIVKVQTTPSSLHTMAVIAREMKGRGRWIATTVDTIFRESDFRRYVEAWADASPSADVMMAVTDFVDDEKPLWVATPPGSRVITGFHDSRQNDTTFVSGGIYGFSDNAIRVLEEAVEGGVSRMRNYQRALIDAGLRVEYFPMGKIIDVDHAGDISIANAFIHNE